MNDFVRRIRRLQKQLSVKVSTVTLIYNNGAERSVPCLEAVCEVLRDHSVVDIRCTGETDQSFFASMLEAEQLYGGNFDDLEELR